MVNLEEIEQLVESPQALRLVEAVLNVSNEASIAICSLALAAVQVAAERDLLKGACGVLATSLKEAQAEVARLSANEKNLVSDLEAYQMCCPECF